MSRFSRPTCETWRHRWHRTVNAPRPADEGVGVSSSLSVGTGTSEYSARFPAGKECEESFVEGAATGASPPGAGVVGTP